LSELSKIEFTNPFSPPHEIGGISIRIYYNNNENEVISQFARRLFDASGNNLEWFIRICSKDEWEALLSKFVNLDERWENYD